MNNKYFSVSRVLQSSVGFGTVSWSLWWHQASLKIKIIWRQRPRRSPIKTGTFSRLFGEVAAAAEFTEVRPPVQLPHLPGRVQRVHHRQVVHPSAQHQAHQGAGTVPPELPHSVHRRVLRYLRQIKLGISACVSTYLPLWIFNCERAVQQGLIWSFILSVCHKSWNSSFKCSPANQSTLWD